MFFNWLISYTFVFVTVCQNVFGASWGTVELKGVDTNPFIPIRIGGQVINVQVSLAKNNLFVNSFQCPYCPGEQLYDESRSNTKGPDVDNTTIDIMRTRLSTEKVDLAEGISVDNTSIAIIDFITSNSSSKYDGGILSLAASTQNYSLISPRNGPTTPGLFKELYDNGSILNPTVALKLGGAGNGKVDIGFIDEDAYEGDISWIKQIEPQETWANPLALQVDEFLGLSNEVINGSQNFRMYLDPLSAYTYLPSDIFSTFLNQSAEVANFAEEFNINQLKIPCNTPNITFRPIINGIDYPLSNDDSTSPISGQLENCSVNVFRSQSTPSDPDTTAEFGMFGTLGAAWLRTVYLVYRFPTEGCSGYIGIGRLKDRNLPQPISTSPRTRPSQDEASQCLVFKPTSGSAASADLKSNAPPRGYLDAPEGLLKESNLKTYNGIGDRQLVINAEELLADAPRLQESNTTDDDGFWSFFGRR